MGIVDNIPISIGRIEILTSFQVLESKDEVLILGNNWLREAKANMNWEQSTLTIRKGETVIKIRITFTKTSKVITQEVDDNSDYNEEELDDYYVYYSDRSDVETSDEELDFEYNPWVDTYSPNYSEESDQETEVVSKFGNPAIFLAENEAPNKNKPEEPRAEHNVGPLTYHQQQSFDNVLRDYSDICAKSQTEIGRTTIIKHRIHVGDALPIAQKPYRLNPENAKFVNEELQKMEANGIVRRSYSPWASPVVIVGKKGGDKRLF